MISGEMGHSGDCLPNPMIAYNRVGASGEGIAAMEVAAMEVITGGVLLLIGFICGYSIRARISRRRREEYRRRHPERYPEY
jgi:hypothetical protein